MPFTVAIVGRPNVGKSTLFNRLAGKRLAIVDDSPGVTRDWRRAPAEIGGIAFEVMDTAGLDNADNRVLEGRMREQTLKAIARAVYFGAKVLILDEPTSALGVRQSGIVLKYVLAAKDRGVSVVFITHNPHHAYLVGDYFYLLNRGHLANEFERKHVELDELTKAMAGGAELDALTAEIQQVRDIA